MIETIYSEYRQLTDDKSREEFVARLSFQQVYALERRFHKEPDWNECEESSYTPEYLCAMGSVIEREIKVAAVLQEVGLEHDVAWDLTWLAALPQEEWSEYARFQVEELRRIREEARGTRANC
jgi:hypothetical protein